MGQIKNYYQVIKEIITGEEYLSDKDKFTLLLHFCALVHIIDAAFFLGFGDILMLLYNLVAFLIYESCVSLAKNKKFKIISIITMVEVLVFVTFTTIIYGNNLYFNIYCFMIIPTVFYVTATSKEYKHPFVFATIVSLLTTAIFIFSVFYPGGNGLARINEHPFLTIVTKVGNIFVTADLMAVISFLFGMEMKNSYQALENRNNQLVRLSKRDPLTKLPNRRSMAEQLNLAMHKLKREKKKFCVILGDIDDFKKVNDTYGHDCGDKVLVMVANTISSQLRDGDYVCRWGGEEILIIVNGNMDAAKAFGERVLNKIKNQKVEYEGNIFNITMTFGIAEANESLRIEDFITQADNRLYYGKAHGKAQVVSEIPVSKITN